MRNARAHDPNGRRVVHRHGSWEVRAGVDLQLWDPEREVSLLLPSPYVAEFFELLTPTGWPLEIHDYGVLVHLAESRFQITLPPWAHLRAWLRWHIRTARISCERAELASVHLLQPSALR
ncbi:MAG: hypothetical protein AAGE52_00350 [Myxococcota bacterium]